jgi:hypothetical protein
MERTSPQVLAMGLQKAGTTISALALASAMNATHELEVAYQCCMRLRSGGRKCWRDEHAPLFGGNTAQFLKKCKTQLNHTVLKADDLLWDFPQLASYTRSHTTSVNIRFLFLVRHPFPNIASLQAFRLRQMKDRNKDSVLYARIFLHGANASALALRWRDAARLYLHNPGAWNAVLRYEELLLWPMHTLATVYRALFRTASAPDEWRSRIPDVQHAFGAKQIIARGDYRHKDRVETLLPAADTLTVTAVCDAEMRRLGYRATGRLPTSATHGVWPGAYETWLADGLTAPSSSTSFIPKILIEQSMPFGIDPEWLESLAIGPMATS